ncbi:MAG: molecular chaperone DnaK, partial [Planctomycetota bacterium]
ELEAKIKEEDTAAITTAMEELMKASHKLAEQVYKASAEQQAAEQQAAGQEGPQAEQPAGATADAGDDEKVIDADFEVKD